MYLITNTGEFILDDITIAVIRGGSFVGERGFDFLRIVVWFDIYLTIVISRLILQYRDSTSPENPRRRGRYPDRATARRKMEDGRFRPSGIRKMEDGTEPADFETPSGWRPGE